MEIGDLFVATRPIVNGLGCVSAGKVFKLVEILKSQSCDHDPIYRFDHKDSRMVFSTFYPEKWFEAMGVNASQEQKKEKIMYEKMKRALKLKRGEHIVGSIDKQTGSLSFSTNPSNHGTSYHKALAEAKRLAGLETGKKFVVVEVKAIASAVDIVVE